MSTTVVTFSASPRSQNIIGCKAAITSATRPKDHIHGRGPIPRAQHETAMPKFSCGEAGSGSGAVTAVAWEQIGSLAGEIPHAMGVATHTHK